MNLSVWSGCGCGWRMRILLCLLSLSFLALSNALGKSDLIWSHVSRHLISFKIPFANILSMSRSALPPLAKLHCLLFFFFQYSLSSSISLLKHDWNIRCHFDGVWDVWFSGLCISGGPQIQLNYSLCYLRSVGRRDLIYLRGVFVGWSNPGHIKHW